jgi:hypothetical protein
MMMAAMVTDTLRMLAMVVMLKLRSLRGRSDTSFAIGDDAGDGGDVGDYDPDYDPDYDDEDDEDDEDD